MATTLFLRDLASTLAGAGQKAMLARRGRTAVTTTTTTTAGGTSIPVTATAGGQALTWFSEPFTKGFSITVTDTIEYSIRVRESATTVNALIAVTLDRTNNAGVVQSTPRGIFNVGTEAGTTEATRTSTQPCADTTFAVGDRIKLTLTVRNIGTMAAGTFNTYHDGPASAGSGDSFIRFTTLDLVTDEIIEVGASEIAGAGIYG